MQACTHTPHKMHFHIITHIPRDLLMTSRINYTNTVNFMCAFAAAHMRTHTYTHTELCMCAPLQIHLYSWARTLINNTQPKPRQSLFIPPPHTHVPASNFIFVRRSQVKKMWRRAERPRKSTAVRDGLTQFSKQRSLGSGGGSEEEKK